VDQIDYLRRRVGLDQVALGSDFGGSGRMAPAGLETIEGLPLVAYHMLTRGYSEQQIAKVIGGNFVDFIGRVERAARAPGAAQPPSSTRHAR
jgi:membrane dipeptidase